MAATVEEMWAELRAELVTEDGKIWVYKADENDPWTVVHVKRHVTRPEYPLTSDILPYVKGSTIVRKLSIKTKSAAEALKRLKGEFRKLVER